MDDKQYLLDSLKPAESWRIFRIMAEFVDAIARFRGWSEP